MTNEVLAAKQSMAKDEYLVAIKLLLRDGDKLLITHDTFGQWDLPGGRIRRDQFDTPIEEVLSGKILEELGPDLAYQLGEIKTTFRIERSEVGRGDEKVRIFGVGYEAKYLNGDITLGEFHDRFEWINIKTVNLADYSSVSGWVEKLDDYIKMAIKS